MQRNCDTKCYVSRVVVPQTGLPVRGSYSSERGASSGCVILHLFPGLFSCMKYALDALPA